MNLPKVYATNVVKKDIDMTLSTNPLGCSPRAIQAIRKLTKKEISTYPDSSQLIGKIAKFYTVPAGGIVLGNGSEQLIKLICQALVSPDKTVAVERGSFVLFSSEPQLKSAKISYFTFGETPKSQRAPTLLFLANPTTPGGIDRSVREVLAVIDDIQPEFAIVDEANGELGTSSLIPELRKRTNLIILRTFSKTLGLAGLRIGYALTSEEIAQRLQNFQQPFAVTTVSLIAAEASLNDRRFLQKTTSFITRERVFMKKELIRRGFSVSDSVTNNLFVMRPDSASIIAALENRSVGVIDGAYFPENPVPGFRISLRDKKTNRLFLQKLDEALACLVQTNLLPSKEVV